MSAVTTWSIASLFAATKILRSAFFCFEYIRNEISPFVCAVAKRLFLGKSARAIRVFFSRLEFDLNRRVGGYLGLVHDFNFQLLRISERLRHRFYIAERTF